MPEYIDQPEPRGQTIAAVLAIGGIYLALPRNVVVGQYRKMMEEAIAREQVPRDYQSQVKQYFQSLDEK